MKKSYLIIFFAFISVFLTIPLYAAGSVTASCISDGNIVFDGQLTEPEWSAGPWIDVTRCVELGPVPVTAKFKVFKNSTGLVIGVDVTDPDIWVDSGTSWWWDDTIQIFIDANNNHSTTYLADDFHFLLTVGDPYSREDYSHSTTVTARTALRTGGYTAEFLIPWANIGVAPSPGLNIGFDVGITCDQDGFDTREGTLMWNGDEYTFQDTSTFGDLVVDDLCFTRTVTPTNTPYTGSPSFTPTYTATMTVTPWLATGAVLADCVPGGSLVIDGHLNEPEWSGGAWTNIALLEEAFPPAPISARYKVRYDNQGIIVGVEVTDPALYNDSGWWYANDAVDVYIDALHDHAFSFGADDFDFYIPFNGTGIGELFSRTGSSQAGAALISGGYSTEFKIYWSDIGVAPAPGVTFGFDVGVYFDQNGGNREGYLMWNGAYSNTMDTSYFGDLVLGPGCSTPTLTPTATKNATDTQVITPTYTPSAANTFTRTITNTPAMTDTPTVTATSTVTATTTPAGMTSASCITDGGITFDGQLTEPEWSAGPWIDVTRCVELGPVPVTAKFKVFKNSTGLVIGVDVTDPDIWVDSGVNWWWDDTIQIFIDANNNHSTTYLADDFHFLLTVGDPYSREDYSHSTTVTARTALRTGGYTAEFLIPWTNIGVTPLTGLNIGFDVGITCDQDGFDTREGTLMWNGDSYTYQDTSTFGDLVVGAACTAATPTPTQTMTPLPASGAVLADYVYWQNFNLDGILNEPEWGDGTWTSITRIAEGIPPAPVSARYKVKWDDNDLVIGIEVMDPVICTDSWFINPEDDDGIAVFLDRDNSHSASYDSDDGRENILSGMSGYSNNCWFASSYIPGGYSVEIRMPWSSYMGLTPFAGRVMGFDVAAIYDQDGGTRDGILTWNGSLNNWTGTTAFGDLVLGPTYPRPTATYSVTGTPPTPTITPTRTPRPGVVASVTAGCVQSSGFIIDGNLGEPEWAGGTWMDVTRVVEGAPPALVSAKYKVLYDDLGILVGVEVTDAALYNDSTEWFDDDSVEIYIDALYNHSTYYDSDDFQFHMGYGDAGPEELNGKLGATLAGTVATAGGYTAEFRIFWADLGLPPSPGLLIGFDVAVNYDQDGINREGTLMWNGTNMNWANTIDFGDLIIGPECPSPTLTPTATSSMTETPVYTATGTDSSTSTVTLTVTETPTAVVTLTATETPTVTETPSIIDTFTITETPTITMTATITATITPTSIAYAGCLADGSITFDGQLDEPEWSAGPWMDVTRCVELGPVPVTAKFKVFKNSTGLVIGVNVTDPNIYTDSGASWWWDDTIQIFIDANNNHSTTYLADDFHFLLTVGDPYSREEYGHSATVTARTALRAGGYTAEFLIPWTNIGVTLSPSLNIGFDVGITCDQNGGNNREGTLMWNGDAYTYQNTSTFGDLVVDDMCLTRTMTPTNTPFAGTPSFTATYTITQTLTPWPTSGAVLADFVWWQNLVMDGKLDEPEWQDGTWTSITRAAEGPQSAPVSARYKVKWDNTHLVIGIEVIDPDIYTDSYFVNPEDDDCIAVFLDGDNDHSASYDSNDHKENVLCGVVGYGGDFRYGSSVIPGGYSVEIRITWATYMGLTPFAGMVMGFDVGTIYDQDGGAREGILVWNGSLNNWFGTAQYGDMVLGPTYPAPTPTNTITGTPPTCTSTPTSTPRPPAALATAFCVQGGSFIIDGNLNEPEWTGGTWTDVTRVVEGAPPAPVSAKYKVLYDDSGILVGVEVTDSALYNDSAEWFNDDSVEIYIDALYNHSTYYDSDDFQFHMGYGDAGPEELNGKLGATQAGTIATAGGYTAEFRIYWADLGIPPSPGLPIGFDVAVNYDQDGIDREGTLMWNGTNQNWANTTDFGDLVQGPACPSPTPTVTVTGTETPVVSMTNTPTVTMTESASPTFTETKFETATETQTCSMEVTPVDTDTETATPTIMPPTDTETVTLTPTSTDVTTPGATDTETETPTVMTPTYTFTATPTLSPGTTDTYTPTITSTISPTAVNTSTITATDTQNPPINTATPQPSQTNTAAWSDTSTPVATFTPTPTLTNTVYVPITTATNTPASTETPVIYPTPSPTAVQDMGAPVINIVYPVPCRENVNIEYTVRQGGAEVSFMVYTIALRKVAQIDRVMTEGRHVETIEIGNRWGNGVYIIRYTHKSGNITENKVSQFIVLK